MVAPIIVITIAASTLLSGYSGKKIYDAHKDNKEAKLVNEDANARVEKINKELDEVRTVANDALYELGKLKIKILKNNIDNFIENFSRIKNVDVDDICLPNDLNKIKFDIQTIEEFETMSKFAKVYATGLGAGATIGAVTAFGAYSGTMTLGVAGTGTAIATLHGAAATNATLAFLGGGTIAAGGAGITGGVMVLGSVVAVPALLVFACYTNNKAQKNKEDAYTNLEIAKDYVETMNIIKLKCLNVTEIANSIYNKIENLLKIFLDFESRFQDIVCYTGTDWREYTVEEKNNIAVCLVLLQALKALLKHSIFDENGEVNEYNKLSQQSNELIEKYGL